MIFTVVRYSIQAIYFLCTSNALVITEAGSIFDLQDLSPSKWSSTLTSETFANNAAHSYDTSLMKNTIQNF